MSEINYRQQWADGEIEAGTLLDAIDAMAQRCRELEAENADLQAGIMAASHFAEGSYTLRAEVERLQAKLQRIEYVAECGSVQSWLALPDKEKARWFGLHLEQDSERLRLRNALRKVIVAAGGMAGPDVSTEFLEQAPLEVMALRGEKERLHMLNGLPSEDVYRQQSLELIELRAQLQLLREIAGCANTAGSSHET